MCADTGITEKREEIQNRNIFLKEGHKRAKIKRLTAQTDTFGPQSDNFVTQTATFGALTEKVQKVTKWGDTL